MSSPISSFIYQCDSAKTAPKDASDQDDDADFKATHEDLMKTIKYAFKVKLEFSTRPFNAFNYWYELPEAQMKVLIDSTIMFFTSGTMFDDMQDGTKMRNGLPSVHIAHGVPYTLNAANFLWFKAMKSLIAVYPPEKRFAALDLIFTRKCTFDVGTGMDAYWRDMRHCPSLEQYYTMVWKRSSNILELSCRLMALLSTSPNKDVDLDPLCDIFGKWQQIANDYENLKGSQGEMKGFCEDISEGQYTMPIIFALEHYKREDNTALERILKQRTQDMELKRYALELIEESGALEKTLQEQRKMEEAIVKEVERLGGNPQVALMWPVTYL